jgi:hypothetical protein
MFILYSHWLVARRKKKGVTTSAVQEMRIVKIIYSYYCEQRIVGGCAVCIDWCYSSLPTYRDTSRHLQRPFWIHRLATESRGRTIALMTSRQPRFHNLTLSCQPLCKMVVCDVKCIEQIGSYLGINCGRLSTNESGKVILF